MSRTFQRPRDLRFRRVDETAVVILQEEARVLVLNDVGARVLELIDGQTSSEDLVAAIAEEYEIDAETAGRDVRAFLAEMEEARLIELRS